MNLKGYGRRITWLSVSAAATLSMVIGSTALPASAHTAHTQTHAKAMTIAFLRPGPDPYYQYGFVGAKLAGQRLGIKVTDYFANTSASQELANVEDAISKHVDGITGYAFSLSAETADIAKANAAHIPIFLLYGYNKADMGKVAGFEQVNLQAYARPVGRYMAMHLKSGEVGIITGVLGRGDAEGYATGFKQGLAMNKNNKVVVQQAGDWNRQKAFAAAQNIITAHPNLKGLFVENEDMALGAVNALTQAHKLGQVMIVSLNGAPYGLAAIRAGQIKASDTCSPSLEGVMAIRLLRGVINHTVMPGHLYYSKTVFVTKGTTSMANPWNPKPSDVTRYLHMPLLKPVPANQLP